MANNLSSLDNIFEKFIDNLHRLNLKLNSNKTKCVIFGKKLFNFKTITLKLTLLMFLSQKNT